MPTRSRRLKTSEVSDAEGQGQSGKTVGEAADVAKQRGGEGSQGASSPASSQKGAARSSQEAAREALTNAPAMHKWPSMSPYGLMQERAPTPWEMLLGCALLPKATRSMAADALAGLGRRWSAPARFARASVAQVEKELGLHGYCRPRAKRLIRLSEDYALGGWSNPSAMYGVRGASLDSWSMFVEGKLDVEPNDGELRAWMEWARRERWWWFDARSSA